MKALQSLQMMCGVAFPLLQTNSRDKSANGAIGQHKDDDAYV